MYTGSAKRRWVGWGAGLGLLLALGAMVLIPPIYARTIHPLKLTLWGKQTLAGRLAEVGPAARARLRPHFDAAGGGAGGGGVAWPPEQVILIVFKQERRLELYAGTGSLRFIRAYPVLAASGKLGPKLRQGDNQVPEGIYDIESLNPNSAYHLSMRISYPNDFDRRMAAEDGRAAQAGFDPGGDIMIHGRAASAGCVAVGDEAIEELFTLVADSGVSSVRVLMVPVDFRVKQMEAGTMARLPGWVPGLYERLKAEMAGLPSQAVDPSSRR